MTRNAFSGPQAATLSDRSRGTAVRRGFAIVFIDLLRPR